MRYYAFSIMALLALSATGGGCGQGNSLDLQAVSGKVTLDSNPLDIGTIYFRPDAKGGLLSGASITAGEYRIPKEKGLPPGKYIVEISSALAGSSPPPPSEPGIAPLPLQERIPEKYNSKSQLAVELKTDGGNILNFDLTTK